MAGTIVVDRIESDASYASTINVAGQITFSNTVNFGVFGGTAPVAGFYLPSTSNLVFTTASTERMRINSSGNTFIGVTGATWDERLGIRPVSSTGQVGLGVYSTSTTYTSSLIRVQSENPTGSAYKLYEGRGAGGGVNYWVDGDGNGYFAGNLQFNSGYGSVATAYGCRAWVNFDGTGTVAIRASGNVSSITDLGTGAYTVNLTTAMPDTNYACAMAVRGSSGAGTAVVAVEHAGLAARTTTSVSLYAIALNSATPDTNLIEVMFFR
jgi:hypothetical protein